MRRQNWNELESNSILQAERERALKDMTTLCTVCGLSKDYLTTNGISWSTHVEREHNIWSYVTFFYYLQEHDGRFSAVENEVLIKWIYYEMSSLFYS